MKSRLWSGIAIGAATLAVLTGIKLLFVEQVGAPTPFMLYFGAVLLAAWYGGNGPGLVTSLLCALTANYFFVGTPYSWTTSSAGFVGTGVFLFEGAVLTAVTARLQSARLASVRAGAEARNALAKLTAVLAGVEDGITMYDADGKLLYANATAAVIAGSESAAAMMRTPPEELLARFDHVDADGDAAPLKEFPGHVLLRDPNAKQSVSRLRNRQTGKEQWASVRSNAIAGEDGKLRFLVNVFRDITDERRQQAALKMSQEWFATALRSIGDAVITTDQNGIVTFLNPAAATLTGWSSGEAAGRVIHDVFPAFDEITRLAIENPVDRVLKEGAVVTKSERSMIRRRDGSEMAVDDNAAPIKTDSGELAGVVLVFRDVSAERRRDARKAFLMSATAALNSSLDYEETLSTVTRLAVPAIADWCAVDMVEGDGWKRLAVAHVDPAKIALVSEIERLYPPDRNAANGVPNVIRTGQAELLSNMPPAMFEMVAVDARHLDLIQKLELHSYMCVPIKHGVHTVGVVTLAMAESQRRYDDNDLRFAVALGERAAVAIENARLFREAEQLRMDAASQRDRLYAMIMAAPTAICVLKRPGLTFEMMNEPYQKRLGGAREGGEIAAVNPDATSTAMLESVFQTGTPRMAIETPVNADYADGLHTHYLSYSVQPLRDLDGKVDRIVVFVNDVTEQVLIRKHLEQARAEAELASRSKDEFLAMLGHELRNPLAPILTALQLMSLRANGALQRERDVIERQVKHVVRLVDDLLDVSRITGGKVELTKEIVDIADPLAKGIEMAAPLIEQRKHTVTTDVEPGLLLDGDPIRLAQVIGNLLNNAGKYTEPGGQISIHATAVHGQMVLRIKDNGIGITAEMLPKVFELFVQERQGLDRTQGGLGLGLSIVRSLVTLHGGTVEAHSAGLGHGTEIEVRLPLVATGTKRSTDTGPMKAVEGERIMIVDDNLDALELLADSLELLGYRTYTASDAAAALVLAAKEKPPIALLDIGLPVMNGYELARRLRETEGLAGMKLVALTGYGQASDREQTAAAGFDAHLVKPVTVQAVQAAIARLTPK